MRGLLPEISGNEDLKELSDILNTGKTAELMSNKSAVKRLRKTFAAFTSDVYKIRDGNSERLASRQEMDSPSEYLFADRVFHTDKGVYSRLAVVLWCATLTNRYAHIADINVVYIKDKLNSGKKKGDFAAAVKSNLKPWGVAPPPIGGTAPKPLSKNQKNAPLKGRIFLIKVLLLLFFQEKKWGVGQSPTVLRF